MSTAQNRIDRFVRREALALFLYARSRSTRLTVTWTKPYRTSFELAECEVAEAEVGG